MDLEDYPSFFTWDNGSSEDLEVYFNVTKGNYSNGVSSFYFYEFEQLAFLWILLCMIVVGNSSVLACIILAKSQHKTRMNFFIMHLALADLSVGLINVLTDIIWKMTISFYMGNVACKLVKFFQTVVLYSSNYVLVALSIDRYYAITHPLKFSGSWRRARILVATAWILSFIFASPTIIIFHEEAIENVPQCWLQYIGDRLFMRVYITIVFTALYVLPALIIAVCYTIMVRNIWTQSRILTPQGKKSSNSNGILRKTLRNGGGEVEEKVDEVNLRRSSRGVIPKAKIKSVKLTFVIVFVFIICASPYVVWTLLDVYDVFPITQTKVALSTFFHSLSPINSAINPFVYALSSRMFSHRKIKFLNWLMERLCPRLGKSDANVNRRRFGPNQHGQDTSQKTSTHFTSLTDSLIKSTSTSLGGRSVTSRLSQGSSHRKADGKPVISYPSSSGGPLSASIKEVRFGDGPVINS